MLVNFIMRGSVNGLWYPQASLIQINLKFMPGTLVFLFYQIKSIDANIITSILKNGLNTFVRQEEKAVLRKKSA